MKFSTRLALFLIALLVAVQAATGVATYAVIRGTLIGQGAAQLTSGATQFTRQLDEIARQMAAGVKILTLDYALRRAVAEHDHNTVVSALRNHGRRVGASRMLLVDTDGTIGADTHPPAGADRGLFAYPALLEQAAENQRVATVAVLNGEAVWLVVVPVLAPDAIAFVAAALPLDDEMLARLRVLAGLPAATGLAIAAPDGDWHMTAGPIDTALAVQLPAVGGRQTAEPSIITTKTGETIFLFRLLETPPGSPSVAAVMAYPLSDALRPFRRIIAVVLGALGFGLIAAMVGAWLVARGVVRPLEALARYAGRVGAGDYTSPPEPGGRDEIGQLSAALGGMTRAIAEREDHVRHQASHDPVTGLLNRQTLAATIDATPMRGSAAVVVIGLMRLQEIANTVGRELAERVMRDAATRLAAALGNATLGSATLGCVGERSFAALLPGCDADAALAIGARVIAALDHPYREGDLTTDTAVAIGVALAPEHGTTAALLLRRAEVAQQSALHTKDRAAVYRADADPHRPELLSLMGELRRGLQRGELQLYYQPKLDLDSRRITGAEAVVRWQHPTRGMISPDSFIGLAEETGNIGDLTRWALQSGMTQAALWHSQGLELRLALNLSVRDLGDDELPQRIAALLRDTALPTAALVLEITESAIMGRPDAAIAVLRRLADLGIALAIDDFGVGQSSLAYLRRLPVSELKIDKAFVQRLAQSPDDQTIVRSVIELGHSLGYRVTAEGVEDAVSLDVLAGFGCDEAQGYAIARPLPAESFDRFVAAWHATRVLAGTAPAGPAA